MERPFALHITWTTYGTWVPGDPRGYVSHTLHAPGQWQARENTPRTPYAADHSRTRQIAAKLQKDTPILLETAQAETVASTLIESVVPRGWIIGRAAIMANHVHVVIFDTPPDGPAVRRILKGTTQAALSASYGSSRRWWTAGGSDRYKNDDAAIENALRYVENQEHVLVAIRDNAIFAGTTGTSPVAREDS